MTFLFLLFASCDEYSKEKNEAIDTIKNRISDPNSFRFDNMVIEDISYRHVMYYKQFVYNASEDKALNKKGR